MPTANEEILDATISHSVGVEKYSNDTVRKILAALMRSNERLALELQAAIMKAPKTRFNIERLESLLFSVNQTLKESFYASDKQLQLDLKDFADYEASFQAMMLKDALPAVVSVGSVVGDQVYAAAMARPFQGILLKDALQGINAATQAKIKQTITAGIIENRTTDQIVREIIGTKAKNYADGLMNKSRRDVETIVRSSISHVAAVGRDMTAKKNEDIIKAVKWVSTIDLRTTDTCFPAETLVLPVGSLNSVSKRFWQGDMVIVTTASGKKIKATPNHPVLTARGWRPIGEIDPSQDVLYRVCSDVGSVSSAEDIEMPATFGAIADSLNKPAIVDVLIKSTSKGEFHGDGMIGKHEVYNASFKCDLGSVINSSLSEKAAKQFFVFIANPELLTTDSGLNSALERAGFWNKPAKINPSLIENGIKTRFTNPSLTNDICGLDSTDIHINNFSFVPPDFSLTSLKGGHDAFVFKNSSDSGCGDAITNGNSGSGGSVRVLIDNVVSVDREFFAGHVYNLSSSTELYIANGFIVHNCRIHDGKLYTPVTHKPLGHSIPWGAGAGRAHYNCRSVSVPVLKSYKEMGIDIEGDANISSTRSSLDGQVPADKSYAQWIKEQSAERQDEVLGVTRGKLLREGGLQMEDLYSFRGEFLTIDELRKKEYGAFKKAGI